ncbi:MAG TPA: dihydrodipicolinate synthase family protein [Actinomycetota bacterium]|nr:dihydrodipicolinate synthase family protein [Actinomycetota bacterium]
MSSEPVFTGVGVALVTLFDESGEVDAGATAEHAARLVELGVRAVLVAGSTGEAAALSVDERTLLVRAVRKQLPPGTVPVLAGTGAPSARQAVEFTRSALEEGADAALVLSPPGIADSRPYYDAVARAAGGIPVLAYHWPAMATPGIPVEALPGLPVDGLKDSSGDADRLLKTVTSWDRPLYVGSSALLSYAGPLGCAGAILGLANADPERCIAAFAGDAGAQKELADGHFQAGSQFPLGIKRLTAGRFGTPVFARLG